jgi:flagellar hook-basal body complex protein FliE
MSLNGIGGTPPLPPGRGDIESVLAQMRAMKARASLDVSGGAAAALTADRAVSGATGEAQFTPFSQKLKSALDTVNTLQKDAGKRAEEFAAGRSNDLIGTMLAMQKSDVAFQATLQVRNRLVSAYQDIMNMPI